jgi:polar amino acid transport system substrate-binding protein
VNVLVSLLIAITGLLAGASALADPTITLTYEERAPYQTRAGGAVQGLTASPAAMAFKAAAVPFVWEASSMSRQLHILRENQGSQCVVGWFKTSERLAFAKYTKPIYRDGPIVALARRGFGLGPGRTLEHALATPGLRILVRGKYSYGAYIDSTLGRIKPLTIASALTNQQLTELLVGNRADLMFASEEEATVLLRLAGGKASDLHLVRFSDVLPGEERHIVCTRNVPDATIARLNSVIAFK